MTTYRLIAISDGVERGVGIVDTLSLAPDAVLIISVSPDVLDHDMEILRKEFRSFFDQCEGWKDRPIAVVRGGDMRFLRLASVEGLPE